jgi:hypothetical protein
MATLTLRMMAQMRMRSKRRPAGVSASKMTT